MYVFFVCASLSLSLSLSLFLSLFSRRTVAHTSGVELGAGCSAVMASTTLAPVAGRASSYRWAYPVTVMVGWRGPARPTRRARPALVDQQAGESGRGVSTARWRSSCGTYPPTEADGSVPLAPFVSTFGSVLARPDAVWAQYLTISVPLRRLVVVVIAGLGLAVGCGDTGPKQQGDNRSQECIGWQNLLSIDQQNGEKPSVIKHDQAQIDRYC